MMIRKCPCCGKNTYKADIDYCEFWGAWVLCEEHGGCDSCGYRCEMAYSEPLEFFVDVKRGFRDHKDNYIKKDIRKHKRNRKRVNTDGMPINPFWAQYI